MPTAVPSITAPWIDIRLNAEEAAKPVALPSPEAPLRYRLSYWTARLASLTGPHRLRPSCSTRYSAPFSLTPALRERWADLFDERRGPSGTVYPFLCAQGVITLLHTRIFADLGVNVRHVVQLRQGVQLAAPAEELSRVGEQQVDSALKRVVRVGPTEVLVIIATRVARADGTLLADIEDSFVVRRLDMGLTAQAETDDALRRTVSRLRRHEPAIDPLGHGVRTRQLYLGPTIERRFGRVAGEREAAPAPLPVIGLLTMRRPAVQRAYLRNLVVRELAEWGLDLSTLRIVFTARARIGQTLRLMEHGGCFELFDEVGRLVAHGSLHDAVRAAAVTSVPAAA